MRLIKQLFFVIFIVSCSGKQPASIGETPFQIKMNEDFKDASKSPLKPKDLKKFEGLDFFPFDSAFVVKATLKRTPDSEWFNMRTTTDRISKERVYGVLSFQLKGISYQLNVYQGEENLETEGMEDYLFLPFFDNTNGDTTYGGGRYIDLAIPDGNVMTIDFNKAYNPYCAYNEKYSCPIVPRANYLNLEVTAGVKKFEKL